jgi:hypothetical protein
LERGRDLQGLVTKNQKELSDLGISNPSLLAKIARGDVSGVSKENAAAVAYAKTMAGRAGALRQLAENGNQDQIEGVRSSLYNNGNYKFEDEQVYNAGRAGTGKLFVQDPGLAFGGFDTSGEVMDSTVRQLRGEGIAELAGSAGAVERTFGSTGRKDNVLGIEGGAAFHLDTSNLKLGLNDRNATKTTVDGRKALHKAFVTDFSTQENKAKVQEQQARAASATAAAQGDQVKAKQHQDRANSIADSIQRFRANSQYIASRIDASGNLI